MTGWSIYDSGVGEGISEGGAIELITVAPLHFPSLQADVHHLCSNMPRRVAVTVQKNEIGAQNGWDCSCVTKLITKPTSWDVSFLLVMLILISFVPSFFGTFGIANSFIWLACAFINLAICAAGYLTGRFRVFWVLWAFSSVIVLVLVGMATPLEVVLILWKI